MGCERPDGIGVKLFRDSKIKFPPNWEGELPAPSSRKELEQLLGDQFKKRNLTEEQITETLDFFEKYEARYYERKDSQCYHRPCNGGAMVEGELGIYCANCDKLPDLTPPKFF